MLTKSQTLADLRDGFRWNIPEFYNIGTDISDRPAALTPDATAIIDVGADGQATHHSFAQLRDRSNQCANVISELTAPGDRVAVLLPQCFEVAVAHAAALKAGRISLPLFTLFGPEALRHRLKDSGASVLITNAESAPGIAALRDDLPALQHVLIVGDSFDEMCNAAPATFTPANTRADDPALLIYTSGTTGNPKGALHAHHVLLGHLPGVEMSHDFFPQPDDLIWTPADWAWIGGLLDVLMPALHHGVPVVAHRFRKFTSAGAFDLIRRYNVRNAFLPPTALKLMRLDTASAPVRMRSVASGGEPLGAGLIDWGRDMLGTTINEFYGQTECNMIVSSCQVLAPAEPGVMGFAVPGHTVDVLDPDTGAPQAVGALGEIAVRAPDPVMLLEYWNNPDATTEKFRTVSGERWLITGDQGHKTETGRIAFVGRDDDVISSGGYRIGPGEIEDCLLTHPAVQLAGVVGQPDPIRGEIVVAYIQLAEGHEATDALADTIADHVRTRLAAYEFPRAVRFINTMPQTTTGKIIRADLRKLALKEPGP